MSTRLDVTTAQGDFAFLDRNATLALAAIRAHRMVDAIARGNDLTPVRTQIPYSSIIIVGYTLTISANQSEDDNCKVRIPAAVEPEPAPIDPDTPEA